MTEHSTMSRITVIALSRLHSIKSKSKRERRLYNIITSRETYYTN